MKRVIKALIVGVVVFVVLNLMFFVVPRVVFGLERPFYIFFDILLPGKLYLSLFGSEYREVVMLSVVISVISIIITYFIIPKKNEN